MTRIIVAGQQEEWEQDSRAFNELPGASTRRRFERKGHASAEKDIGLMSGCGECNIPLVDNLEAVIDSGDVIIDFTMPESTLNKYTISCFQEEVHDYRDHRPLTTTDRHYRKICVGGPGVLAPNERRRESYFQGAEDVAKVLGDDYDIEIVEAHHRLKKDAPRERPQDGPGNPKLSTDLDGRGVYARKE